jgi:triacylglycerol lipase
MDDANHKPIRQEFVFVEDEQPVFLPIWKEVFTGLDWLRLRSSLVYYGASVPQGNGAAVITVPGFLGSDVYLTEMNLWLGRIGYKAYRSRIGRNAECPDILVDRLMTTIEKAADETGGGVHLIGHSLGGVISRAAARLIPEYVASVIVLGSPFRGIRSHPSVLRTSKVVKKRLEARRHQRPPDKPLHESCFTGSCNCAFAEAIRSGLPEGIHETAIYTKSDGVVDWKVCITGNAEADIEVSGTHCGLAWNPEVYRHVAQRLYDAREAEHRRAFLERGGALAAGIV